MNQAALSPEKEKELWHKHHVESLLSWADLPLTAKIKMLGDMEETARALHGGKLPKTADEHDLPPNLR